MSKPDQPSAQTHRDAGQFVLASASPRRQELLRQAGYRFVIAPADIDESSVAVDRPPEETARRIALAKLSAVAARFPTRIILAADTVVGLGPIILGKAGDPTEAGRILRQLSGSTHQVITAVAILRPGSPAPLIQSVVSTVQMKSLSDGEIESYVATNAWQGKAGAYGIQDADPFVTRISGCHTNIVGLPMTTTRAMLEAAGISPI